MSIIELNLKINIKFDQNLIMLSAFVDNNSDKDYYISELPLYYANILISGPSEIRCYSEPPSYLSSIDTLSYFNQHYPYILSNSHMKADISLLSACSNIEHARVGTYLVTYTTYLHTCLSYDNCDDGLLSGYANMTLSKDILLNLGKPYIPPDTLVLSGSNSSDTLVANTEINILTGNGDADIFVINTSSIAGAQIIITDFNPGEDRVDLSVFTNCQFENLNLTYSDSSLDINLNNSNTVSIEKNYLFDATTLPFLSVIGCTLTLSSEDIKSLNQICSSLSQIIITSPGVYVGTNYADKFIINTTGSVDIISGNGLDVFKIVQRDNNYISIIDFDQNNDKIIYSGSCKTTELEVKNIFEQKNCTTSTNYAMAAVNSNLRCTSPLLSSSNNINQLPLLLIPQNNMEIFKVCPTIFTKAFNEFEVFGYQLLSIIPQYRINSTECAILEFKDYGSTNYSSSAFTSFINSTYAQIKIISFLLESINFNEANIACSSFVENTETKREQNSNLERLMLESNDIHHGIFYLLEGNNEPSSFYQNETGIFFVSVDTNNNQKLKLQEAICPENLCNQKICFSGESFDFFPVQLI